MRSQKKISRVYLRPVKLSDCDEFIAMARTSAAFHRGWVKPARTPAQFAVWLRNSRKKTNSFNLVCLKETDEIIGAMNFSQIFHGALRSAYLGYYVRKERTGQGLMTEAMQLAQHHAFTTLKLHRFEANIQPDNTASIALVKRTGFTKEGFSRRYLKVGGTWCDHERWAILREDWQSKK